MFGFRSFRDYGRGTREREIEDAEYDYANPPEPSLSWGQRIQSWLQTINLPFRF